MKNRDDLLDLLADLQHNLGKYIRLPLSMIEEGASEEQYRTALKSALLQTRKGPSGVLTARQLWEEFVEEAAPQLRDMAEFKALVTAVKHALNWEIYIDPGSPPMPVSDIQDDLAAVSDAIRHLLEGVKNAT